VPTCDAWEVQSIRTPPGVYYGSADEAFANLMTTTEDFDFAGGDFVCRRNDSNCLDNDGSIVFALSAACDGP
jgi:hypothetical protein